MRSWIKPALHTLLQDALITAQADLVREMSKINTELADMAEKTGDDYAEAMEKVRFLRKSVEASTVDNLVFYGIEENNMSDNTEMAVKEVSEDQTIVIKQREMPYVKVWL